jgi:transcription elongation GreA/GreB family factor
MEEKIIFKHRLKDIALQLLGERLRAAELAMQQAQEAANNEEKSSVGDKYETGRAMGQNNSAMNARQVEQAKRELLLMQTINVDRVYTSVVPGSIALCGDQIYFISVGLGVIDSGQHKVIFISPQAPLCQQLLGKQVGDSFVLKQNQVAIFDVF